MMDGAGRHEASHHAHKEHHHHHATHHAAHRSDKFDSDVYAAHDAWAAWKSHDPAAWDAALDLRDKISPKAWRHAMHEIDLEEAAQKKKHAEHLPQVSIQSDERVALGGSSSRVPSGRNYYEGSQVPGYYEGAQQRAQGNRTYVEQYSGSEYSYQTNHYRTPNSPMDESYRYERNVVPQTRSYSQNDVYQYDAEPRSYYPSRNSSYYPDQNYGYRDQDYRYYPQNSGNYGYDQDYRYYPRNSGNYGYDQYPGNYGYGNYGYGGYGNYGYGRQNVGAWLGPVIGGSAGALFDRHNRWRGTVIGSALGSVLGSVIQDVSLGGFGTGYGGYGIYY